MRVGASLILVLCLCDRCNNLEREDGPILHMYDCIFMF